MGLNSYDPKLVTINFAGQVITGFADGTFVTVERDEDNFALQIGADGEGTRSKSNNKAGTITVVLQQGSPSNAVFAAVAVADEVTGDQIVPTRVRDNSGDSLHFAATSWLQKPASAAYAKEAGDREWVIRTNDLQTAPAGNG